MSGITYTAIVGSNPTQYYGTIIVSDIKYEDGSQVSVDKFLGVTFKSPAAVDENAITVAVTPWQAVTKDVSNEQIDETTYLVTARLNFPSSHKIDTSDTFTIGINGDLTKDPDVYLKSFVFAADALPDLNGTVEITAAAAPNPALASEKVTLSFIQGSRNISASVSPGTTTSIQIPKGVYSVSCAELMTEDQTVVAASQVSPSSLTVNTGETTAAEVTFGEAQSYSAIDVSIGNISSLEDETFRVRLALEGRPPLVFDSQENQTTSLRRLPASGTAEISIDDISLNNVAYVFSTKTVALSATLFDVTFAESDLSTTPADTTGFVQLPIVIASDVDLDRDILVRIKSDMYIYTQKVAAKAGTTPFSVPVAPGEYTVQDTSFILNGIVFAVDCLSKLTVADDGSTQLKMQLAQGANLFVRGFPDFMSFGGLADLTPSNTDDFVAARASSVFKYAGVDGAGDKGNFLTDDTATRRTIQLARDIEAKLNDGSSVLPTMISYTCNLSLGDIHSQLQDKTGLAHSFGNLILSLNIANDTIDNNHPVPAGYIVNADFLGEGQKENLVDYAMPVREPLQGALDHWNIKETIPGSITDTIAGYTQAVNWLIRTVAPDVTFGWQVNIWGGGSSTWIYNSGPDNQDPREQAEKTAQYIKQLGTYDGEYAPDFLAVDRYEADDWTQRAYINGYFYGPHEWRRYYDFVKYLSLKLQVPVMPWQIPTSRAPLVTDVVMNSFDPQHWGTGGSYLLGDDGVNSDYENINPLVLEVKMNASLVQADTAAEVWQRGEPFDLSLPAYSDFPLRGVFALQLGGGSTTGIISTVGNAGPWVSSRLSAYRDDPIRLDDAPFNGMRARRRTVRVLRR